MSTDSNLALHGEPIIVSDSTDNISPFDDPINIDNFEVKTLTFPADVTVPIIASSPSRDSPNSSVSSNSSTARTSKVTIIPTPIKWSDADLSKAPQLPPITLAILIQMPSQTTSSASSTQTS